MSMLVHQRCQLHPEREAAVRCPQCGRFYCRECVTEHLGRMICAHCVAESEANEATARFSIAGWSALSVTGFLVAWLVFYYLGMALARIPSSFHEMVP